MRLIKAVLPVMCLLLLCGCGAKGASLAKNGSMTPAEVGTMAGAQGDTLPGDDAEDPEFAGFKLSPEDLAALTPQEKQALDSDVGFSFDLEKYETQEMERYFVYFTHKARPTFERWLERAQPYLPYVRSVLQEKGLPEGIMVLPFAESGYNNFALSHAGALGMWQFMPATGKRFNLEVDWWLDERRDPAKATRAAAEYLSQLHAMFGDWYLALAAYNAGEGKISWALGKSGCDNFFDLAKERSLLKDETKQYVPKFLAILKIFSNLEELGFKPVNWDVTMDREPVDVPAGTDLLALAQSCAMPWTEFQALNPSFQRQVSPPKTTTVYLPKAKVELAAAYLADPRAKAYAGYRPYTVRKGDTWARVAKRTDIPVEALKAVNRQVADLKPGDAILVPGQVPSEQALAAADAREARETKKLQAAQAAGYVVKKGDTIHSIASKLGVDQKTLMAANGLKSPKDLSIGRKLNLPAAGVQVAAKTETAKPETARNPEKAPAKTVQVAAKPEAKPDKAKIAEKAPAKGDKAVKAAESKAAKAVAVRETEVVKPKAKVVDHKVAEGETVWSIARKFNVDPKGLLALNNLDMNARLKPGATLKVALP